MRSFNKALAALEGTYFRKLLRLQIYTTNRCNSHCLHCKIWRYRPKTDLPLDIISKIADSKCVSSQTHICLEGGEFILHPLWKGVLKLLKGREVSLISNGIETGKLCNMVEEFNFRAVIISLDGNQETYRVMRGVNRYKDVIESIKRLKGKVLTIILFTASPFNDIKDYLHVKRFCARNKVSMALNMYTDQPYFMTEHPSSPLRKRFDIRKVEDTPGASGSVISDRENFRLHDLWLSGKVKVPCLTIFRTLCIYPEGDVFFCHRRAALLGNLHDQSLDEIWNSKRTIRLQKQYASCNKCWCSCHRPYDAGFLRGQDKK